MTSAIHQHELAIGRYDPSVLNFLPTFLLIPFFSVVTKHQLWVPCIIQQIPTGYLFYIW